ncbi:MAG TPA: SufD family Fe-S cluster assembly protein, partial [Pirellulaceae bacterium]
MIATQTTVASGFGQEGLESFLAGTDEPAWLSALRRDAWERFQNLPWPSRSDEEWSRTDIRLFRLTDFKPPTRAVDDRNDLGPRATPLLTEGVDRGGSVSTFQGWPGESWLKPAWAEQGVRFGSLNACVAAAPDLLRPYLEQPLIPADTDRFAALQSAFWMGGALLYVPARVVIDQPLHVISELADGGVDLSRLLVILEEGAEATLLTELESCDVRGRGLHCGAVEIHLAPRARLRFVSLQNWNKDVWHFAHHKAVVGRDASLQWTSGALGSRLSKVNQHVALVGPGAESQVNGVLFTEGKQHLSYHTLQHHRAPHGRSDFLYKAALQDESRTVWRG